VLSLCYGADGVIVANGSFLCGFSLATGGTHRLFVAGNPVAEDKLEHTAPMRFSGYAGMDVGRDNGLPDSPGKVYYLRAPFPFEGAIERVVFDIL
jgi:hypothetical protein